MDRILNIKEISDEILFQKCQKYNAKDVYDVIDVFNYIIYDLSKYKNLKEVETEIEQYVKNQVSSSIF